ncbi:hypothetical protein SYNPS1DRAFT_28517 [Syncephalis pseudoplumigaleata]|uniref:Uncharacterized protein n=1 Tax=Syncephalis pseudoplumigaleata TaxID=1712513 RepID=A0A4P9Z1F3_9FUNG|nr:hypothetical protein SYNPS1DRAFT_28517 [Syncephalis pseudoplumigaleata]|eukprot:RKP25762.1 hypothetical protein SYNPS1DRAFT_28517 [Syncephalis pseudoplumigaleata]
MLPVSKLAMPIAAAFLALVTLSHTAHGSGSKGHIAKENARNVDGLNLRQLKFSKNALGIDGFELYDPIDKYSAAGMYKRKGGPEVPAVAFCGKPGVGPSSFLSLHAIATAPAGSALSKMRNYVQLEAKGTFKGHICYVIHGSPGIDIFDDYVFNVGLANRIPLVLPNMKTHIVAPIGESLTIAEKTSPEVEGKEDRAIMIRSDGKYTTVPSHFTVKRHASLEQGYSDDEKKTFYKDKVHGVTLIPKKGNPLTLPKEDDFMIIKSKEKIMALPKEKLLAIMDQMIEAYYDTEDERIKFTLLEYVLRTNLSDVKGLKRAQAFAKEATRSFYTIIGTLYAFTHADITMENINEQIRLGIMQMIALHPGLAADVPLGVNKRAKARKPSQ